MAIRHRTKEQKRAASARRLTYSLPQTNTRSVSVSKTKSKVVEPSAPQNKADLYDYHPNLIKRDLLKTLLVSLIVLIVELGLYYYL